MNEYKILNVKDIREIFKSKLLNNDKVGNTIEIINATFIADEDIIFGKLSQKYAKIEHEWYLKQSLSIFDMCDFSDIPKIWKDIADKRGNINSNYGWCVFSEKNYSQFLNVVNELQNNKNSRRAIMYYSRPSMHIDAFKNGMNDFMCTSCVQYLIRDNKLNGIVTMRSNDAIFGYKYDVLWQKYILKELSNKLNIEIGNLYWNVGSLHIYERHYDLIK